jgi:hypothetical protein
LVDDRDGELAVQAFGSGRIPRAADDILLRALVDDGDELHLASGLGMGRALEEARRELGQRREEPVVARLDRQGAYGVLQLLLVVRADRAHRHVPPVAQLHVDGIDVGCSRFAVHMGLLRCRSFLSDHGDRLDASHGSAVMARSDVMGRRTSTAMMMSVPGGLRAGAAPCAT